MTKHTISSKATTCSKVLTKSPFAPVCFIVIIVDAGAVADASALNTKENGKDKPKIKNVRINTNIEATSDSNMVMIIVLLPLFFNTSNLKNSPVLKAINANAISAIKSIPDMMEDGIKLKQNGPINIPATIYAVTLGSFSLFVILVKANPMNNINPTEIIIRITGDTSSLDK